MGYPKALLPLGTGTFLTRILATIQKTGLPSSFVVLGKAAPIIQPRIRQWHAKVLINPDPSQGQLSSIKLALSHLELDFNACLIWPVDQPAISERLVLDLIQLFIDSRARIVLPTCGNKRGHPAIFDRILFRELMAAPLQEGPKEVLLRHRQETATLPTDELGTIQDIDTPEDYYALTGEMPDSALARAANDDLRLTNDD